MAYPKVFYTTSRIHHNVDADIAIEVDELAPNQWQIDFWFKESIPLEIRRQSCFEGLFLNDPKLVLETVETGAALIANTFGYSILVIDTMADKYGEMFMEYDNPLSKAICLAVTTMSQKYEAILQKAKQNY